MAQPLTGYNAHEDFVNQAFLSFLSLSLLKFPQYAKSIATPESGPLTAKAVNSFFNYIIENGVNAPFVCLNHAQPTSQALINDLYFSGRVGFQSSTFTGDPTPRLMPSPRLSLPFPDGQTFGSFKIMRAELGALPLPLSLSLTVLTTLSQVPNPKRCLERI